MTAKKTQAKGKPVKSAAKGKATKPAADKTRNPATYPPVNMDTADSPTFNTFTKSYKTRYVVHASRVDDERTICGRNIESRSDQPFDEDVPGACLKCSQRMKIERRIHPGWGG